MNTVITIMLVQGFLGAADTLYYHEWRYRLPGRPEVTARELRLHATRDFVYAIVFATLPCFAWSGACAWLLAALLLAEIIITLTDFVVERETRSDQGGVATGELVTHVIMAIVYGAFLSQLAPHLIQWSAGPTGLLPHTVVAPELELLCFAMAAGVFASGVRDLGSSVGVRALAWPWAGDDAGTAKPRAAKPQ